MIGKFKTRITFTTTIARARWLRKTAKMNRMQISELINYFITNGQDLGMTLDEQQMNELARIAKTPWLED